MRNSTTPTVPFGGNIQAYKPSNSDLLSGVDPAVLERIRRNKAEANKTKKNDGWNLDDIARSTRKPTPANRTTQATQPSTPPKKPFVATVRGVSPEELARAKSNPKRVLTGSVKIPKPQEPKFSLKDLNATAEHLQKNIGGVPVRKASVALQKNREKSSEMNRLLEEKAKQKITSNRKELSELDIKIEQATKRGEVKAAALLHAYRNLVKKSQIDPEVIEDFQNKLTEFVSEKSGPRRVENTFVVSESAVLLKEFCKNPNHPNAEKMTALEFVYGIQKELEQCDGPYECRLFFNGKAAAFQKTSKPIPNEFFEQIITKLK
jgi:hypothetical protein